MSLASQLEQRLDAIKKAGRFREHWLRASAQGVRVRVDGRELLNFSSNDYLGLANDPQVAAALQNAVGQNGVGSGSAHLISGHTQSHQALENELADFLGVERCLLFSTGYMANVGVISALVGRGDRVYQDRLNHASLLDGGLLSGARFSRFPHVDMAALGERLRRTDHSGNQLIVTDGVFSMDGDIAPIVELVQLARKNSAWLMVDDAHGLGVLGSGGRGTLEHLGVAADEVDVLVGTLGKSLGTFGAFVAGSGSLVEYLIQTARSYIYTTAMPPALAEATRTSLALMQRDTWRRDALGHAIARFRERATELGLPLLDSETPIQPLLIGGEANVMRIAERLRDKGFWVGAIRPPTVAPGKSRLRITLSALHDDSMLDSLLAALQQAVHELNIVE